MWTEFNNCNCSAAFTYDTEDPEYIRIQNKTVYSQELRIINNVLRILWILRIIGKSAYKIKIRILRILECILRILKIINDVLRIVRILRMVGMSEYKIKIRILRILRIQGMLKINTISQDPQYLQNPHAPQDLQ